MYDAIITEKSISESKGSQSYPQLTYDLSSRTHLLCERFNFVYDHDKKLLSSFSSSIKNQYKRSAS